VKICLNECFVRETHVQCEQFRSESICSGLKQPCIFSCVFSVTVDVHFLCEIFVVFFCICGLLFRECTLCALSVKCDAFFEVKFS